MLMHRRYRKYRYTQSSGIYHIVKQRLAMRNNVSSRYDHVGIIGFNSTLVL